MECFKCGISGDRVKLINVVSQEGIVKICKVCSSEENLPEIKSLTDFQRKKPTVYDRLSKLSGVSPDDSHKTNRFLNKQDIHLKRIVDRAYSNNIEKTSGNREDLVRNFHWAIKSARRSNGLTQLALANAIAEPETVIRMAESGILPKECYDLVRKLESYLKIKLIIKNIPLKIGTEKIKEFSLDLQKTKTLTISDLQKIKKDKENSLISSKSNLFNIPKEDIKELEEFDMENEENLSNRKNLIEE